MKNASGMNDSNCESQTLVVRAVVVAPSFNNAATLANLLDEITELNLPLVLVNDGSTDATADVISSWLRQHPRAEVTAIQHRRNRGKAAALRSGFAAAQRAGYTHAITIDTDGQHDPAYLPDLLEQAQRHPCAYVLGVRDQRHPDYPSASRLGRRISNLLVRLECGLRVADSQCGMRIYPLQLVRTVRCRAGHFGYETEMITRAGWAGCPVVQTPINTCYLPPAQRVSHFRPWVDSIRAAAMHCRLLLRAVILRPRQRYPDARSARGPGHWATDFFRWLNPLRAWRELRGGRLDRNELATALALGVFVANLPVYPFQTLLCLYLARRLHLNPLPAVAGSQISTPPLGLALIAAAICLGNLILHGALPPLPHLHSARSVWSLARPMLLDWVVGGVICGVLLAIAAFALILAPILDGKLFLTRPN